MNYFYDRTTIVKRNRRLRTLNRLLVVITAILTFISICLSYWASSSMVV